MRGAGAADDPFEVLSSDDGGWEPEGGAEGRERAFRDVLVDNRPGYVDLLLILTYYPHRVSGWPVPRTTTPAFLQAASVTCSSSLGG